MSDLSTSIYAARGGSRITAGWSTRTACLDRGSKSTFRTRHNLGAVSLSQEVMLNLPERASVEQVPCFTHSLEIRDDQTEVRGILIEAPNTEIHRPDLRPRC